jgi:hypothetical protein
MIDRRLLQMQFRQYARLPVTALNLKIAGWQKYRWLLHPLGAFIITRLAIFAAAFIGMFSSIYWPVGIANGISGLCRKVIG